MCLSTFTKLLQTHTLTHTLSHTTTAPPSRHRWGQAETQTSSVLVLCSQYGPTISAATYRGWFSEKKLSSIAIMNVATHGTVQSLVKRGRITPQNLTACMRNVALNLAAVGRSGIVHRDISPCNILAFAGDSDSVRLVISDFGLACMASEQVGAPGKNGFVAPEIISGHMSGVIGDWFSFGVTWLMIGVWVHDPSPTRKSDIYSHFNHMVNTKGVNGIGKLLEQLTLWELGFLKACLLESPLQRAFAVAPYIMGCRRSDMLRWHYLWRILLFPKWMFFTFLFVCFAAVIGFFHQLNWQSVILLGVVIYFSINYFAPRSDHLSQDIVLAPESTWTATCDTCHTLYLSPPPRWDCLTCRTKTWQPDSFAKCHVYISISVNAQWY